MKASILEIYKDYCIVITADGRFVRQNTPAGAYEVGDEIDIRDAKLLVAREKKPFSMFLRLAAGFAAVVVLSFSAYFGIKYSGLSPALSAVKVASEEASAQMAGADVQEDTEGSYQVSEQGEKLTAAEVSVPEQDAAKSQTAQSSGDTAQPGQPDTQEPVQESEINSSVTASNDSLAMVPLALLFEGNFKLDKNNIDVLTDYPDLHITYRYELSYSQDEGTAEIPALVLKIKNLQKSTFNGYIDIILTGGNKSYLQTSVIEISNLVFNDEYMENIQIEQETESFIMKLYGNFLEP